MTPPLPDSDAADYITAVLTLYLVLPETPLRVSAHEGTVGGDDDRLAFAAAIDDF